MMMMTMLAARTRGRSAGRRGDDGSIAFAMLLVLVGSALAALMLPMLLTQMTATRSDTSRVRALHAAQAGLNVGIGHIRSAIDRSGVGVLSQLPCGTLTGPVGVGSASSYSVVVSYYSVDPKGLSSSALAAANIQCLAGGGAASSPSYALLVAQGISGSPASPARTLQATYVFQTSNLNGAGGLFHVTGGSPDLCIDAGSGSPAAGTVATMQVCNSNSVAQKLFYNQNLTISLPASQTAALPLGMCLDGGTPETATSVVKFQACSSLNLPQQHWSYDDNGDFSGTANGSTVTAHCFTVQSPNVVGSQITLDPSCTGFSPEAPAGVGAAGAYLGELVNLGEYSRCLEVTAHLVSASFLVAWPCVQSPNSSGMPWYQQWALPTITAPATSATGQITTNPKTQYCLQSPLSTLSGQYVVVVPCTTGSTPSNLSWTVFGATTDYASSYRIVDSSGNCLQPTDPTATSPDFYSGGTNVSKVVVAACTSSSLQKWNAPPNTLSPSALKDIGER